MTDDQRPLLLCVQHSIGYPDEAWPAIAAECRRIGMSVHADRAVLPLWSVQELRLLDELASWYLFTLRLRDLKQLRRTWQDNWLEMLLERCCAHRVNLAWYGKEMTRAWTYARWVVAGCVGAVFVADADLRFHAELVLAAQAAGVPCFRIDPETYAVFKIRPTTKEEPS